MDIIFDFECQGLRVIDGYNFFSPVVSACAVALIVLNDLISCPNVLQGTGLNFAVVFFLVVDHLAIGVFAVINESVSIPQGQQHITVLVVHRPVNALPHKLLGMRFDKLINVVLGQRNNRPNFEITNFLAFNRGIRSPPNGSLGDILKSEEAEARK